VSGRAAAICGLVAVKQCQLRGQVRRNSRADRAERRWQDHDVHLLTGPLRANSGEIAFAGTRSPASKQFHIARANLPHLPARQAAPRHDAARQRAARPYSRTKNRPARRRPAPEPGPEEASARYEALRQLERVGLGDKPFELAGNLPLGISGVLEIARALAADQRARARRAGGRPAPPGKAQLAELFAALRSII